MPAQIATGAVAKDCLRPGGSNEQPRTCGAATRAWPTAVRSDDPGVLLVDDEPRLRALLGAVLADYGVVIVGEAGTGREGVELAYRLRPDVVLMDLRMPELDGIAATRLLSESLPSTAVIVLSAYDDPALISEARQAGASAYLVKGCRASLLVEAIEKAAADRADAPPSAAEPAGRLPAESPDA
jgi:DNA-binding NarL/FixJ family response regulator